MTLVSRSPDDLVNEPWAAVMSSVLQTVADHLETAVTTPHPAAYLMAKILALYQVEVETSVSVHHSIPVIKTEVGNDPHILTVKAMGTSSQAPCVLEESVDSLYGQEAIVLRFKYAFPMSAHERAASQLRFYVEPKEDESDKGRYQVEVDANGCYAYRNDSILSLLSIMRGFPIGSFENAGMQVIGALKKGMLCQPQGTDEGAHCRIYCYGSLYAASRRREDTGKWVAARLPENEDFVPL